MGAKLDELKDGDTVKVMYDMNQDGTNTVTQLSKEE
jgi:Cu/Ag efflux protein CusF